MDTSRQFVKFGIVGGSGTIVNLVVVAAARTLAGAIGGVSEHDVFFNLFGTEYNVRWYHVFVVLGFLVANLSNYQINRCWTFRGRVARSWLRGFIPFLLTGVGALVVSQVVVTLLMNPTSPIALPADVFDDSSFIRTKLYWATMIGILVSTPVNFLINKLWAFRGPRFQRVSPKKRETPGFGVMGTGEPAEPVPAEPARRG